MPIKNLFVMSNAGVLNSRGEWYTLTRNEALADLIKFWISTKKGDIVGFPTYGGFPYMFLNIPLTPENAAAFRSWLYQSLSQEFEIKLEIQTLEVEADPVNRRWIVYGSFYSEEYAAVAKLQFAINN